MLGLTIETIIIIAAVILNLIANVILVIIKIKKAKSIKKETGQTEAELEAEKLAEQEAITNEIIALSEQLTNLQSKITNKNKI